MGYIDQFDMLGRLALELVLLEMGHPLESGAVAAAQAGAGGGGDGATSGGGVSLHSGEQTKKSADARENGHAFIHLDPKPLPCSREQPSWSRSATRAGR